jgi:hypothetical protein
MWRRWTFKHENESRFQLVVTIEYSLAISFDQTRNRHWGRFQAGRGHRRLGMLVSGGTGETT